MDSKDKEFVRELLADEDDFDVDLMAAGCRVVRRTALGLVDPQEIVALYDFGVDDVCEVLGRLVADGHVDSKTVFRISEDIANRKIRPDNSPS